VNIDQVLPVAREHRVGVLAKRPIANAAWKEPDQQPGLYRDYASEYHKRLKQMRLNPADLGFPGAPADVWPEIALRFTLSIDGVNTAIIGTTNPDNARANIAYAEKGPLLPETVKRIREAFKRAQAAAEGAWTGQT
jgi:aryl-alcohol dehydrogenase-like predicted oxidoreductase